MNLPTKITIARVLLIPVFIFLWYSKLLGPMAFGSLKSIVVTGAFIFLSLTDWLDGYLARKNNQVTDFGKFLDPIADKILVFSVYLLLLDESIIEPISLIIMLSREFVVATVRMTAAQKGIVIAADMGGKIKTVLQMISIVMLLACLQTLSSTMSIVTYAMYWISVILTVSSGYSYTAAYIKATKE